MVCRILVADDSATIQKVIRIGLAVIPNEIKAVGSLVEATKIVEPDKFDLIIADAGLPGVSTASDFVKLADRAGSLPVIILMGSYDSVRESDLRAVGLTNIVKKPFPPGELPQLVQQLIGPVKSNNTKPVTSSAKVQQESKPSVSIDLPPVPFSISDEITKVDQMAPLPVSPLGSMFSGDEMGSVSSIPTPSPEVEPGRKGRPAFELGDLQESILNSSQVLPSLEGINENPPKLADATSHLGMSAAVEEIIRESLPNLVDRAVQRYCVENFKGVAREVLTNELRRLADEKARYLVDQ